MLLRNSRSVDILEESEIKDNGVARKMFHPLQQFAHRKIGKIRDIKLILVRIEVRLHERRET